jgi:hypothetical protein
MNGAFLDYYRCPESFATFTLSGELSEESGYFRFGRAAIGFGQSSAGFRAGRATDALYDTLADVVADGLAIQLPFRPSEIITNLRYERYASGSNGDEGTLGVAAALRKAYYLARPLLPVAVRKHLQRIHLRDWEAIPFPRWPVDATVEGILEQLLVLSLGTHGVDRVPFVWFWPNGAPSCAIMTHDVETVSGRDFCSQLMDVDDAAGIKSSFQVIPEGGYSVSGGFLKTIRDRGFEVDIHDLNHDGRLFTDRNRFLVRAERINRYGREYGAAGFRSAALYRNQEWLEALDFRYDMSVPSAGHLEAQRGGCCSVMPFFIGKMLELPVTTSQDYSLFHILNEYSIDLWKRQVSLIMEKHGLASFIVHPDYIRERRAQETYKALLAHLGQLRSEGRVWMALPREVNEWWRERSQMRLIRRGTAWEIEGAGKERARIAYASLDGDVVGYRLDEGRSTTGE